MTENEVKPHEIRNISKRGSSVIHPNSLKAILPYQFGKGIMDPVECGKKGGPSPRRKYAMKLRHMKERGVKDKDIDWFCKRLEDSDVSSFHLMQWIDEIKKDAKPLQQQRLIDLSLTLHKLQHGEKLKTENVNLNIDVETALDEIWNTRKGEIEKS